MGPFTADVVVLDIEGTVSPISAVKDRLFTYTSEHLAEWLRADSPLAREVRAETAARAGHDTLSPDAAVHVLRAWISLDVKAGPLKKAQGDICRAGFRAGELTGVFYPDVRPALEAWRRAGCAVLRYSSGSAQNQRDWFAHAAHGSLAHLLDGCHDLESAGPKDDPASYLRISDTTGYRPERTLFLSDAPGELTAARTAGWATVLVTRPDTPGAGADGVPSLHEIDIAPGAREPAATRP